MQDGHSGMVKICLREHEVWNFDTLAILVKIFEEKQLWSTANLTSTSYITIAIGSTSAFITLSNSCEKHKMVNPFLSELPVKTCFWVIGSI